MATTSRDEQETIISYDRELDQWHYYSDVPKHNHKWDKVVVPDRKVVEPSGSISVLEGTIRGSVSISKPRKLSEAQRQQLADRLEKARKGVKQHEV